MTPPLNSHKEEHREKFQKGIRASNHIKTKGGSLLHQGGREGSSQTKEKHLFFWSTKRKRDGRRFKIPARKKGERGWLAGEGRRGILCCEKEKP